jgi:hypothetical protein
MFVVFSNLNSLLTQPAECIQYIYKKSGGKRTCISQVLTATIRLDISAVIHQSIFNKYLHIQYKVIDKNTKYKYNWSHWI